MTFKFLPQLPNDFSGQSVLISGQNSIGFRSQEFLSVDDNDSVYIFEIRYEVLCSPFKQAVLIDSILGVGHEDHFYLFDLKANANIKTVKFAGYFGHIYLDNSLFYIADANGLYCLNIKGDEIWKNTNLGIDGVIVETFEDETILGAGEWDPPNGWRDFKLNKLTGELIK
jgi:hypothetical protein